MNKRRDCLIEILIENLRFCLGLIHQSLSSMGRNRFRPVCLGLKFGLFLLSVSLLQGFIVCLDLLFNGFLSCLFFSPSSLL